MIFKPYASVSSLFVSVTCLFNRGQKEMNFILHFNMKKGSSYSIFSTKKWVIVNQNIIMLMMSPKIKCTNVVVRYRQGIVFGYFSSKWKWVLGEVKSNCVLGPSSEQHFCWGLENPIMPRKGFHGLHTRQAWVQTCYPDCWGRAKEKEVREAGRVPSSSLGICSLAMVLVSGLICISAWPCSCWLWLDWLVYWLTRPFQALSCPQGGAWSPGLWLVSQ